MKYMFLDTNIFLHFKFFDQIKWNEIVKDEFKIMLAPTVIDELDKHKRNTNSKIANRAKKALNRIDQILEEIVPSYPIEYLSQKPDNSTLSKFNLQREEQDDCIIATILEFKERDNGKEIIFVTNDTGPKLKSKSYGIQTIKLTEEYLMPNEKTEVEKQLASLIAENNNLKNKIPKINLTFAHGEVVLKHHFEQYKIDRQSFVNDEYDREKVRLRPIPDRNSDSERATSLNDENLTPLQRAVNNANLNFGFNRLSQEQIDVYNKDLRNYYDEYLQYLCEKYEYDQYLSLLFPINLELLNTGNFPAEDIDVWLHFPDGFVLYNPEESRTEPIPPLEPFRPQNMFDHPRINFMDLYPASNIKSASNIQLANFSNSGIPDIRQTNSYEVEYRFGSLKHNQSLKLSTLIVEFSSFSEIKSFSLDYKIMVGNIPNLLEGKLNISLTK
ncbi:rRNA-processing protein FCF1 [Chryseobacterium sp. H1D6B]|uniref:PIN domain-containing protein n=1 Tax=Chryseobacterium sp. H1D6B TaxID=2940588 RepID=UPI0015C803E8|nr:PIN domain-containing protein [Chryseobacterium sp. H1D6B]MDH6254207.1 rRNA-processing protein FCF1 [Chryseobacterium sp. H1D6B]